LNFQFYKPCSLSGNHKTDIVEYTLLSIPIKSILETSTRKFRACIGSRSSFGMESCKGDTQLSLTFLILSQRQRLLPLFWILSHCLGTQEKGKGTQMMTDE
jgi:hypothetical protein